MKIFRANKPVVVDYLEPHLLSDEFLSKEALCNALKSMLVENPDETLVMVAYDEDVLKAFMIVFADPGADYAVVIQTWSEAPVNTLKSMFFRVCLWAEARSKSFLRAETSRKMEGFLRDFGFQETSKVMVFQVSDDGHAEIVDDLIAGQKPKELEGPPQVVRAVTAVEDAVSKLEKANPDAKEKDDGKETEKP